MQTVDFTSLVAVCGELAQDWIPAKLEQVYQKDRNTIAISLRTMKKRGWLDISWHPTAARICLGNAPPKVPDTFTFSEQLRAKLKGFALINLEFIAPFERVLDFQFANRPGESPLWHLYVEIMGKYSNVILTNAEKEIVTVAHQVNASQSRIRTVETGQPYDLPPNLTKTIPSLNESQSLWQERVSLIPKKIKSQLISNYAGLSPSLIQQMLAVASINPDRTTDKIEANEWEKLFQLWQKWLQALETSTFKPGWTKDGYTVMGWTIIEPLESIQILLNSYYTEKIDREIFQQLHHQLTQKVNNILSKLKQKAQSFQNRLKQSDDADSHREKADLLMAYLHHWQPGMKLIKLPDFETGKEVKIALNPEKNAVQNAQGFYKLHQKLKRARDAVSPLLEEVITDINYLEQIETNLTQLQDYNFREDLETLEEIKQELIEQGYLENTSKRAFNSNHTSQPYLYKTPTGFEVWIGRNNRQNDQLTFRTANEYDLWFHTQEIPGSHVLLRLKPGEIPDENDLQFAADLAAYYSKARSSEVVSVVYTEPKYVYKPKGAKPGIAVYKRERVIWGKPQRGHIISNKSKA